MAITLLLRMDGGNEELEVVRMSGREAISELFDFTIDIHMAPGQTLPESFAAGAGASLVFRDGDTDKRVIHGMLRTVAVVVDGGAEYRTHRVSLVPRAFRAALIKTQQIFMDKSVPELIKHKLGLVGLGDDVVVNTIAEYPTREFIVQYQEHDVQFISRLAEHVGLAFYFEHKNGKDELVLSDHNNGFQSSLESISISDRADEPDRVHRLVRRESMIPRTYVIYDYNYRQPDVLLKSKKLLSEGMGGGVIEYGAHVKTPADADAMVAIRAEEQRCRQQKYDGESSICEIESGLLTRLEAHDALPETSLLITEVEHLAEGGGGTTGLRYSNRFTAVDGQRTFRPERRTPTPKIHGIVTGVIQGVDSSTSDKYALLDEYGRYTVQFHFDSALGAGNQKASRPVRKAQPLAGSSEGMHFPLKPGVEVALAFANGDPDRPIIVGALPNHTKGSVVTASDSQLNKIETGTGILIQFGSNSSSS